MGKIELSQRTLIIDFMNSGCSLREVSGALGIAKTKKNIEKEYFFLKLR